MGRSVALPQLAHVRGRTGDCEGDMAADANRFRPALQLAGIRSQNPDSSLARDADVDSARVASADRDNRSG